MMRDRLRFRGLRETASIPPLGLPFLGTLWIVTIQENRMCRPSTVGDDWVVKGCHIHVDGIELVMRPTHSAAYLDGIVFKRFFGSTSDRAFQAAEKKARKECLAD